MDTLFTIVLVIIGCMIGFYDFAIYFNSAIDIAAFKHLWLLLFMVIISLIVTSGITQKTLRPVAFVVALSPLLLFSLVFKSSVTFGSFGIFLSGLIAIFLINKFHAKKDS